MYKNPVMMQDVIKAYEDDLTFNKVRTIICSVLMLGSVFVPNLAVASMVFMFFAMQTYFGVTHWRNDVVDIKTIKEINAR